MASPKTIWTIGHSTRDIDYFIALLVENGIELLADVRSFPGSKRYPHFNSEQLAASVREAGIEYKHVPGLGGRRPPPQDTPSVWRNSGFRGYEAYMKTNEFGTALSELAQLAMQKRVAYMCSEAVWWRCHRGMISDALKDDEWLVLHIMDKGKVQEHPYTTARRQGGLFD